MNVLSAMKSDKISDLEASAMREALEVLVKCIAPMMPHLAEECWNELGFEGLVAEQDWPGFIPELARDEVVVLPVQINGKKRGDLEISPESTPDEIEAATLQLDVVVKHLEGKTPRKIIVVPKRIVNVVV